MSRTDNTRPFEVQANEASIFVGKWDCVIIGGISSHARNGVEYRRRSNRKVRAHGSALARQAQRTFGRGHDRNYEDIDFDTPRIAAECRTMASELEV